MKLSELLKDYNINVRFVIKNEKEFQTLALTQSPIMIPYCTFVEDVEYIKNISDFAVMAFVTENVADEIDLNKIGVCIVENPRIVFFKLHNALLESSEYARVCFDTQIGEKCKLSKLASIDKNNVLIGNNVIIEDFVKIHANTTIGDNCIIRSGTKLGGVDFEFKKDNSEIFGVEHYGGLIINNNVEIQYNSVINRALYPWDNTLIDEYTKIDSNTMISHGVKIGKRCMITAGSVIGGRTVIGDDCWIGLSATIRNGITIGNGARINLGSVVTKDVTLGESVTGNFAINHSKFLFNLKNQIKE